ncbi:hypothetical protein FA95DRAFT_1200754 [Auriscalpium vulgare]|uniref:Uncharacterized protein n=1 Tax=Auriscalpium vulgare TaxID=40419 RepID=A0ACB8R4W2_9AGAM|nr:hypothetical protein FA95DRAFT_1200754 [Auriscalpium vulgare]
MAVFLPDDIFLLIVSEVSSPRDLLCLRAVNRAFCAMATPCAFRTVGATNRQYSALGLASLLQSDLASYVREVVYRDSAATDEHGNAVDAAVQDVQPEDDPYGSAVEKSLVKAFTLAARLPGLTSLCFIFNPKMQDILPAEFEAWNTYEPLKLQWALLDTVGDAAERLRSLTLINLAPDHDNVYSSPAFQRVLPSLTHVCISVAKMATAPSRFTRNVLYYFWQFDIDRWVVMRLANVQSLVLENDHWPSVTPTVLPNANLRKLKYLVTRNLIIGFNSTGLDDFVGRHKMLEWVDVGKGPEGVRWVRHTHADPQDATEYETPPSLTQTSESSGHGR